jgi:uncharacterized protein YdhG (YjbR/CyaY superfamily)
MATTDFKSVAEYIAAQPRSTRAMLRQARAVIRKAVPTAVECISYQIPAFKVEERPFLYLAGFRGHYSIYPAGDRLVAAIKGAAAYRVSKGTLRFSLSEPAPTVLIGRIARFRAGEAERRAKTKGASRKAQKSHDLLK